MSCKDNKDNNKEQNIKDYLNDSLELDGINVSEDLINRTLNAIKQQDAKEKENEELDSHLNNQDRPLNKQEDKSPVTAVSKKIIIWNKYVRRFAGAAAAVLVIFACFGMMRLLPGIGGKKSMSTDQAAYDAAEEKGSTSKNDSDTASGTANGLGSAAGNKADTADKSDTYRNKDAASGTEPEQAQKDSNHQALQSSGKNEVVPSGTSNHGKTSADKTASQNNTETYADASEKKSTSGNEKTKTADLINNENVASAPLTSSKKVASGSGAGPDTTETPNQNTADMAPRLTFSNPNSTALKFSSICKATSGETAYIRITDSVSNTSITLISEAQIQEFITCMEKYQFKTQKLSSGESSFTIDIECPYAVPNHYSLSIGNSLTLKYSVDKQVTESSYGITDYEKLKEDLNGLMKKYQK